MRPEATTLQLPSVTAKARPTRLPTGPTVLPPKPSPAQAPAVTRWRLAYSAFFLSTFFTIFCSSMRKARMIRSRTAFPHRVPPYARLTVFCRFEMDIIFSGLNRGSPISAMPVSPHVCKTPHGAPVSHARRHAHPPGP